MSLEELHNVAMWENDFSVAELIIALIVDEDRNEVNKLDNGLLVLIDLCTLDLDQFVAYVFTNVQSYFVLEHVLDHLVVLGAQQL